jgi:hypothetical protein
LPSVAEELAEDAERAALLWRPSALYGSPPEQSSSPETVFLELTWEGPGEGKIGKFEFDL